MSVDPAHWITGAAGAPLGQQQAAPAPGAGKSVKSEAGQAAGCQGAADREGDGPLPYRPATADDADSDGRSRDASGTRGTRLDLTG